MSPNEVAPWMLLVFFAVTLVAGLYLLLRGQQAASPGGDSVVTALGIKVSSPTPGVAVVVFSIVGLIVTLMVGVLETTNDEGGANLAGEERTSQSATGSHSGSSSGSNDPTDSPPALDLGESNVIDTGDLDAATGGTIGITGWALPPQQARRPVLDCQHVAVVDLDGHQANQGEKKTFWVDGGITANAMTTANVFDTAQHAQDAYDRLVSYLDTCPNDHPDVRHLEATQAGSRFNITVQDHARAVAKNYWTTPDLTVCPGGTTCTWVNSQAVGRIGRIVVLLSIDWYQSAPFDATTDQAGMTAMTEAMQRAMDLADD